MASDTSVAQPSGQGNPAPAQTTPAQRIALYWWECFGADNIQPTECTIEYLYLRLGEKTLRDTIAVLHLATIGFAHTKYPSAFLAGCFVDQCLVTLAAVEVWKK